MPALNPTDEFPGARLWNADALEVLTTLPDKSADLVLVDPPYNVGVEYEASADSLPDADYGLWCGQWFTECKRISRKFVIVFPGHKFFPMWVRQNPPSGIGCWHKPGCPKGGGSFRWTEWEPWLLYSKGGAWCGASDTITAPLVSHGQKGTGKHPCPKPPRLYAELLKRLKPKSVLDPFLGSGTAGVEAVKAGVEFAGIELAPNYYATARSRILESTGTGPGQLLAVSDLFGEVV